MYKSSTLLELHDDESKGGIMTTTNVAQLFILIYVFIKKKLPW